MAKLSMAYESKFYEASGYYGKASLAESLANPGIRAKFDTLYAKMVRSTGVTFRRSLDIGCGASPFSLRLTCAQRVIMDLSFTALWGARGPERVQGDLQNLPFRRQSFDVVIGTDVLEHVPQDGIATAEIGRVGVPGCILVLTVPHRPDLWSSSDIFEGHFRRYTCDGACAILSAAGFRVLSTFKIYGVYLILRAVQSRDRKKMLRAKVHGPRSPQARKKLPAEKSPAEFVLSDVVNVLRLLTRNRIFMALYNPLSKILSKFITLDALLLPFSRVGEIGLIACRMH
jgi:SAM-dependent methyltransferase